MIPITWLRHLLLNQQDHVGLSWRETKWTLLLSMVANLVIESTNCQRQPSEEHWVTGLTDVVCEWKYECVASYCVAITTVTVDMKCPSDLTVKLHLASFLWVSSEFVCLFVFNYKAYLGWECSSLVKCL